MSPMDDHMPAKTVFVFDNLHNGETSITCVSADDEAQAWGILKKNAYADCDVTKRYRLRKD